MKISFIDDEPEIFPLQYGGKARTIINLAKGLARLPDVERVSILSNSINDNRPSFEHDGIRFKKLDGYNTIPAIVDEAADADILSIHNCSIGFPALGSISAVLVYQLHDVLVSDANRGSHLDKALGGHWDAVVAPSDFAANTYKAFQQSIGDKTPVAVIPRPLDLKLFRPVNKAVARGKIGVERAAFPVIFLPWRVDAGKGETYIALLTKILEKDYPDYLILTTFSKTIQSDNPNVRDIGWLQTDELPFYYSASDLVVSFSLLPESFSQICPESIACGTPFLSFGYGNQSDFADELPAARICAPTEAGLRAALKQILEIPDGGSIAESQEIIARKLDTRRIAKAYMSFFERLLKVKKQSGSPASRPRRYLTSPFVTTDDQTAYLSNEKDIISVRLSKPEAELLKECRRPRMAEELLLTFASKDVKISTILRLAAKGLIVEI